MKIVIIGGGSSYTPELIEGIILHRETLPVDEVVLVDIPEGERKVRINTAFAGRMLKKAGANVRVRCTLNREDGLKNASFVITQLRAGGLDARERDERIPLKYGMIGQETTGPGGFMKALRTIPVMLDICRDMRRLCPDAWLINFTNPSGIVTEAVLRFGGVRCIGLCNVSINMQYDAADRLGVKAEELDCRFIGLNHLSVMNHAYYKGQDCIGRVLEATNAGSVVQNINKDARMDILAQKMGCMLSPYMQYFYLEKEMLAQEMQEALSTEGTRACQVKKVEQELFAAYEEERLDEKPEALAKRGGARYSLAAIRLIDSIYNDTRDVQVVDVLNNGTIPGLPADAVIETNCTIGRARSLPLSDAEVPDAVIGLIHQVKAYERLTIEAALSGDKNTALLALLNNPLVHDAGDAEAMLAEMLAANRKELPAYWA